MADKEASNDRIDSSRDPDACGTASKGPPAPPGLLRAVVWAGAVVCCALVACVGVLASLVITGAGGAVCVVCVASVGSGSASSEEVDVAVCVSVAESSSLIVDNDEDEVDLVIFAVLGVGMGENVPICRVVWVMTTAAVDDSPTFCAGAFDVGLPEGHSSSTRAPDSALPSTEVGGTFAPLQTLPKVSSTAWSALLHPAEHTFPCGPCVKSAAVEQPGIAAL
jgi:hypothetical protein